MSSERPTRDILAEMMRRERLGLVRPLWPEWSSIDGDGGPEQWRMRADHLMRLLATAGVALARSGEAEPALPPPTSPVFWRFPMDGGKAERLLRTSGSGIEVVRRADGSEAVQISFTLHDVHNAANALLQGDRETAKRPGILTMLSAALEAYRLDVAVMGQAQ